LPVILLRHSAVLHCEFFWHFNVFVIDILLCVSNFLCVRHFIMCQPFYVISVILCSCSHFVLSHLFPCCVSVILCHGSHFMSSQSFPSCVPAILFYIIYFILCQSFYFFVSHFIYFVSAILFSFQPFNKSILLHIVENVDQ
jgi:hypothetical protein